MVEAARLTEDTLFLACTRPAMIGGVTTEAMALNVMFSCILFLVAGSIIYGLVALPIHGLCRIICRHDPNMFRILLAWIETRGRTRNAPSERRRVRLAETVLAACASRRRL